MVIRRNQSILSPTMLVCVAVIAAESRVFGQPLPCPPEQIQRISPPCERLGTFGTAVAAEDRVLAVAGPDSHPPRVELFEFNQFTRLWDFSNEILHPDPTQLDGFGMSIGLHRIAATDEWLLAVSAESRDTVRRNAGMCYVFRRIAPNQWALEASLTPADPTEDGYLGRELHWCTAQQRTFLVVGAPGHSSHVPGEVFVFERSDSGVWRQQARLTSPNGGQPDGAFGRGIGAAEGFGETILVIGESVYRYVQHTAPGTVFCYRFDPASESWNLETQFQSPSPHEFDSFGYSISVGIVPDNGSNITHRAIVGDPTGGDSGSPEAGAAFVYARHSDGSWLLESRIPYPGLTSPDSQEFGSEVHMKRGGANEALIGATSERFFGRYAGAAFRAVRDEYSGEWSVVQGLFGDKASTNDGYGVDLALGTGSSEGLAVVGSLGERCTEEPNVPIVGAVYSFDLDPGEPGNCPPPVLTLQKVPDCSSGPGGEIEVRWFQATPDRRARIALLFGRRTGNFVIPDGNPCAGTRLGLGALDLQVAYIGSAGDFGAGRIVTNVPRAVCGGRLQLIDITRCKTSNVVRIE